MIEALRRYIKNKHKVKEKSYPALQVLGSKAAVGGFGRFWENHGDDLMTVAAAKLLNYSEHNNYTKEEFAAYKQGIGIVSAFFAQCWAEVKEYEKDH